MLLLSYFLLPSSMGALSLLTLWPQFNDPSFNLFLGVGWLFAGFMDLGYFPMTVASFMVCAYFLARAADGYLERRGVKHEAA